MDNEGNLQRGAKVAVQLGVVVAMVAGAGYMLVNNVDHDITNLLVGSLATAFGVIITQLFGKSGTS